VVEGKDWYVVRRLGDLLVRCIDMLPHEKLLVERSPGQMSKLVRSKSSEVGRRPADPMKARWKSTVVALREDGFRKK
jgi:hypothetical protein